jgi:hypothetical protein
MRASRNADPQAATSARRRANATALLRTTISADMRLPSLEFSVVTVLTQLFFVSPS